MKTTLCPPECLIRRLTDDDWDAAWMLRGRDRPRYNKLMERQAAGELEYIAAFVG